MSFSKYAAGALCLIAVLGGIALLWALGEPEETAAQEEQRIRRWDREDPAWRYCSDSMDRYKYSN